MPAFVITQCPKCKINFPVNCNEWTPIKYRIVKCDCCNIEFNAWDNAQERGD